MAKFSLINSNGIQWLISKIKNHTENKNNPHGVTKAQVGLSNVSNLDQSKAISKVTTSEQGFTGTALDGSTTTWNMPNALKDLRLSSTVWADSIYLDSTYTDGSEVQQAIHRGSENEAGLTRLYNTTGDSEHGAMTQQATTTAINDVNNKIIYTNDGSNNITFPKQVTATQFNGSLNGNAKTATTATSANTANTANTATIATTADKVKNKLKVNLRNPSSPKTSIEFDGSNEQVLDIPAYDDLYPLDACIQIGDDLNNYITPGTYFFPFDNGAGTPIYGDSILPGLDYLENSPFILTVRRCPAQKNNWFIQTIYHQKFPLSSQTLENAPTWKRYGKLDSNEDSVTWESWTCIIDSSILEHMIIQESDITLDLTKATSNTTYPGYPYILYYEIPDCTAYHYPQVQLANKTDGVYINDICKTSQGGIYFYVTKNTGTIEISSILLTCDFKHLFM